MAVLALLDTGPAANIRFAIGVEAVNHNNLEQKFASITMTCRASAKLSPLAAILIRTAFGASVCGVG